MNEAQIEPLRRALGELIPLGPGPQLGSLAQARSLLAPFLAPAPARGIEVRVHTVARHFAAWFSTEGWALSRDGGRSRRIALELAIERLCEALRAAPVSSAA